MIRHWPAVEGDLAREYGITAPELARMSTRRFLALIGAMSDQSRFARAWRATPRRADSPEEIARITGIPAA
ncbi:hypothetical protein [Streptomyces griseoloalbus]|uniref:Uncharacterized protein n=1 Tax=Streptomyces griseoloalbus TaxID=67303 RepID=A0A7W8BU28_9ACTN|nr:hypothetical protein [Streptomyces albaduncus]MBB5128441.1 hypothetical protein [Streptomyces albaduncus]